MKHKYVISVWTLDGFYFFGLELTKVWTVERLGKYKTEPIGYCFYNMAVIIDKTFKFAYFL